jgi:hypothetical protein
MALPHFPYLAIYTLRADGGFAFHSIFSRAQIDGVMKLVTNLRKAQQVPGVVQGNSLHFPPSIPSVAEDFVTLLSESAEYVVDAPDGLTSKPDTMIGYEAALREIPRFVGLYQRQGYYSAVGRRLTLDELRDSLVIRRVPPVATFD